MNGSDAPLKIFFGCDKKMDKKSTHVVQTESGDLTRIYKQSIGLYSKLYSIEQLGAETVEFCEELAIACRGSSQVSGQGANIGRAPGGSLDHGEYTGIYKA